MEDLFFFSSRRRHTRLQGDWSSDVCSSDLFLYNFSSNNNAFDFNPILRAINSAAVGAIAGTVTQDSGGTTSPVPNAQVFLRSEERRVGKECRSRWSPYH